MKKKDQYLWYALGGIAVVLVLIAAVMIIKNNGKKDTNSPQATDGHQVEEQTIDFNDLLNLSGTAQTTADQKENAASSEENTGETVGTEGQETDLEKLIVSQEESNKLIYGQDVIENLFEEMTTASSTEDPEPEDNSEQNNVDNPDGDDSSEEETTKPADESEESSEEPTQNAGTSKEEETTTQHPDPDGPGWSIWVK